MIRPVVFVAVSSLGFLWWLTRPSGHCQSCGHPATEHYEDSQCHGSPPSDPCPCVGYWPPDDSSQISRRRSGSERRLVLTGEPVEIARKLRERAEQTIRLPGRTT